jgi:ribosomal protein S27AE
MGFPANLEELRTSLTSKQTAISAAKNEIDRLKRQCEKDETMAGILKGLMESWKKPDPGKYGDAYFCLDSTLRHRVVVRQFLPEDVKIYRTPEEWFAYTRTIQRGEDYDGVSCWYQTTDIDAVAKDACPRCGQPQLVVEHYVEAYDSPECDEWLKRRLIVCFDCGLITELQEEKSESRF